MLLSFLRPSSCKVESFCGQRTRQSDQEFLTECGIPVDSPTANIALGVRRAITDAGLIDSTFIRPSDRYPDDLGVLPTWDSLDWLDFLIRLDRETNLRLDAKAQKAVCEVPFTVRELINRISSKALA